jgi:hypothetical protein
MNARQSRGRLLTAAWQAAWRYRVYGAYGSETKACMALRRRVPGFSAKQYVNAFRRAVDLHESAVMLVARRSKSLWRLTDLAAKRYPDSRAEVAQLRKLGPGFLASTYLSAVEWVFVWYHLK